MGGSQSSLLRLRSHKTTPPAIMARRTNPPITPPTTGPTMLRRGDEGEPVSAGDDGGMTIDCCGNLKEMLPNSDKNQFTTQAHSPQSERRVHSAQCWAVTSTRRQ
ncbi:unnamed protein product [Somion occarium]|uniref:Uncharacterized protein n=1 Tax=Somion occarium TaxID=3059160 RepID=A0ABP1E3J6_9APHY